jgi:hypothetical protein
MNRTKGIKKEEIVDAQARPQNKCFGCANAFVSHCLSLLEQLAGAPEGIAAVVSGKGGGKGIIEELLHNNLHHATGKTRSEVRRVICLLTKDNLDATRLLNSLINEKLDYAVQHQKSLDLGSFVENEMALLAESCLLQDSVWEERLRLVMQRFFAAVERDASNPVIAEHIILPCLNILVNLATSVRPATVSGLPVPQHLKTTEAMEIDQGATPQKKAGETATVTITATVDSALPSVSYEQWSQTEASYKEWKQQNQGKLINEV